MFQQFFSDSSASFWRFYGTTRILAWQETKAARQGLIRLLAGFGAQNPMLVTDEGVAETGFFKELVGDLKLPRLVVGSEGDLGPMQRFADDANATSADLLIAIGGGSVLDAAKCLAACLPSGSPPEALLQLKQEPEGRCPLICIPTTFGTGSEVNIYSHLHLPEGKISFKRQWLAPGVAILVGEGGVELPQRARYLTAVDAWLHAFEALTLRRERSPILEALMRQALDLHHRHMDGWLHRPDPENGLAMATASCLGGLGINNARTGLIHALAVPFAEHFSLPHNLSLLPFIDPVLELHQKQLRQQLGSALFQEIQNQRRILAPMGQTLLKAHVFQVDETIIATLVLAVQRDAVLFKENPVDLDSQILAELYRRALQKG